MLITLMQDLCHTHTVVHVTFVKYYCTHEEIDAAFRDICHLLPLPNFMEWLFVLSVCQALLLSCLLYGEGTGQTLCLCSRAQVRSYNMQKQKAIEAACV